MSTAGSLVIEELDPFDDATFEAWHEVYATAERHDLDAASSVWQVQELRATMQHPGSSSWSRGWTGKLDGRVVASGWMRTPLLDNTELAEISVHVLPTRRRLGLGATLLETLESVAAARGRRTVTGLVGWASSLGPEGRSAPGPSFARRHGYDLALTEVQRELGLPVPEEVLAGLADDAARAHPAYTRRSWVGPVPDELVEVWAELTSILATEAPTDELDREPEVVSVVAYTDLATTVHEPGRAYQWGTLVRHRDRGHRLGVAVKVANLRLLQRERPDIVRLTTYNAEVNEHMIAVNQALGFRPVARLGDFQKRLGDEGRVSRPR
jgi:GNAT superfamily N-acetyltransferase